MIEEKIDALEEEFPQKNKKQAERRKKDYYKGKRKRQILQDTCKIPEEKLQSALYFSKRNVFYNDSERQFCARVTNDKKRGYNPTMHDKKSDIKQEYDIKEYENENKEK